MHPHPGQLGLNKASESTLPGALHPGVRMLREDRGQSQSSPQQHTPPVGLGPSPTVWALFGHKNPLGPNSE